MPHALVVLQRFISLRSLFLIRRIALVIVISLYLLPLIELNWPVLAVSEVQRELLALVLSALCLLLVLQAHEMLGRHRNYGHVRDAGEVSILLHNLKHAVAVVGGHTLGAAGDHVSLQVEGLKAKVAVVGATDKDRALQLVCDLVWQGFIQIRHTLFVEEVGTVLNRALYHGRYVVVDGQLPTFLALLAFVNLS